MGPGTPAMTGGLAGDLPGSARGQGGGDAMLSGVQAGCVRAKLAAAEVFDPGSPRLRPDRGEYRGGVVGDPQQPPGPQVGVDEFLDGALVAQAPGAQDADMVGVPPGPRT